MAFYCTCTCEKSEMSIDKRYRKNVTIMLRSLKSQKVNIDDASSVNLLAPSRIYEQLVQISTPTAVKATSMRLNC